MIAQHRLHPDLLREVFTQLYDNEPLNLLPVTLVSRSSYLLVVPILYRNITINIYNKVYDNELKWTGETLLRRLLAKASVRNFIKEICIIGDCSEKYRDIEEMGELLENLIPELKLLESFRWEARGSFPDHLVQPLRQHWSDHHFHLHIHATYPSFDKAPINVCDEILSHALETLRSFQIGLPHNLDPRKDIKSRLSTALKNWPALRKFEISDEHAYYNCGRIEPWLILNICPEDRLPQLSELSTTEETLGKGDLERWGEHSGWSQLEKVTVSDHTLLTHMKGCGTKLVSLTVTQASDEADSSLSTFCSHIDGLNDLRMHGLNMQIPVTTLRKHGHSLKTLALRCHADRAKDLNGLAILGDLCPELSSLEMSIGRFPGALDCLAMFPGIAQLANLNLFTGHKYDPKMRAPADGLAYTEKTLHLLGPRIGQQLSSLRVHFGLDFEPTPDWVRLNHRQMTLEGDIYHAKFVSTENQERRIEVKKQVRPVHFLNSEKRLKLPDSAMWGEEAQDGIQEFLDTMPPAILSRLLHSYNDRIRNDHPQFATNQPYEIQTSGSDTKVATYEKEWEEYNPILPLLKWQLQKRQTHGWQLWSMALMQDEAGTEGFLYDRILAEVN